MGHHSLSLSLSLFLSINLSPLFTYRIPRSPYLRRKPSKGLKVAVSDAVLFLYYISLPLSSSLHQSLTPLHLPIPRSPCILSLKGTVEGPQGRRGQRLQDQEEPAEDERDDSSRRHLHGGGGGHSRLRRPSHAGTAWKVRLDSSDNNSSNIYQVYSAEYVHIYIYISEYIRVYYTEYSYEYYFFFTKFFTCFFIFFSGTMKRSSLTPRPTLRVTASTRLPGRG